MREFANSEVAPKVMEMDLTLPGLNHITIQAKVVRIHSAGPFVRVELLTQDVQDARARRMSYRMPLEAPDGSRYYLHGFKHIRDDEGFDLWSDTTTLFVTVHGGEDDSAPVLGRGVLRIRPGDFARQLRTFTVTNAGTLRQRLRAATDFGRFFAGALYDTYLSRSPEERT